MRVQNYHISEKDHIWNPAACSCKNGKYLASINDNSVITCDEIIDRDAEEKETIPTSFNEKKQLVKHKISIFYLHFY